MVEFTFYCPHSQRKMILLTFVLFWLTFPHFHPIQSFGDFKTSAAPSPKNVSCRDSVSLSQHMNCPTRIIVSDLVCCSGVTPVDCKQTPPSFWSHVIFSSQLLSFQIHLLLSVKLQTSTWTIYPHVSITCLVLTVNPLRMNWSPTMTVTSGIFWKFSPLLNPGSFNVSAAWFR